jgi:hypothetical protein
MCAVREAILAHVDEMIYRRQFWAGYEFGLTERVVPDFEREPEAYKPSYKQLQ